MSTWTMDDLRFTRCCWWCSLLGYDNTLPITKATSSSEPSVTTQRSKRHNIAQDHRHLKSWMRPQDAILNMLHHNHKCTYILHINTCSVRPTTHGKMQPWPTKVHRRYKNTNINTWW